MKLRRLALVPAVLAAVLGTTAATWPSSPTPLPQAPPALTASALSVRYAADAQAIGSAERAADRDGDTQLAGTLATMRTQHVLFFSSAGQGLAATRSARGSSPPGTAATAVTWTRARSRCAT